MLWDAEFVSEIKLTVQKVVDFLNKLLGEIFGFIGKEEGWVEEETTEPTV